jgi:hypothetical protein
MKRKRNNDERALGIEAPGRTNISLADILNPEFRDCDARTHAQDRPWQTVSRNDAATASHRVTAFDELARRPDGLRWAAGSGLANAVACQLRSGADPNSTDEHGNTALHFAAGMGYVKVVDLLLIAGADPRAANLKGATALVLAKERGHREVVDRLQGTLYSVLPPRYAQPPALWLGRGTN